MARASIARHPLHPMFIVFPIGLWVFSFVADIVYLAGGGTTWGYAAWYAMGGGIIGAVIAAVPGLVDLLGRTRGRTRKVAVWHGLLNVVVLTLFVISFFSRLREPHSAVGPFVLSCIGLAILVVSSWLGGALVYEYGVAVEGPREHAFKRPEYERPSPPAPPLH